jgi:hypothetical protein
MVVEDGAILNEKKVWVFSTKKRKCRRDLVRKEEG